MIKMQRYTMRIYVKDRRTKSGERLLNTYTYGNRYEGWMQEEVRDLQSGLYPAPKYRLEYEIAPGVV